MVPSLNRLALGACLALPTRSIRSTWVGSCCSLPLPRARDCLSYATLTLVVLVLALGRRTRLCPVALQPPSPSLAAVRCSVGVVRSLPSLRLGEVCCCLWLGYATA